jgi:hypothetical protein
MRKWLTRKQTQQLLDAAAALRSVGRYGPPKP